MGAVRANIWKELQEQAEIIVKLILRLSTKEKGKDRAKTTSARPPPPKFKRKKVLVVDTLAEP